jgi:hypothetical protein
MVKKSNIPGDHPSWNPPFAAGMSNPQWWDKLSTSTFEENISTHCNNRDVVFFDHGEA